ncbi:hypothetical protein V3C99_011145 [Haemonchus contortus]
MSHKAQPPVFAAVKSPPPAYNAKPVTPLAVTFREVSTGGGPTMEEQCTIEHIRSFLGSSEFDEDLCLKAIRHPRLRSQKNTNEEEYLQEVVGVYMDELNHATEKEQQRSQTPRPAIGCANRPMQTIEEAAAEIQQQSGSLTAVPVSCSGPTATTATPLPALTSAAEREQSDIEKAIAESLISQGPPGNRSYVSSLPSNPEDMLRKEGVSVGLHNTGNTCWFNVVAQLLFHLPRFRRVVYEYTPKQPDLSAEGSDQNDDITEVDLVEKMRYLFASMDLGNRRYIDPSEALNVVSALAARSKSDVILGRQQDASEMMSNLMEWMEKGLALEQTDHQEQQEQSGEAVKQSPPLETSRSLEAMEISPMASVEATGSALPDATASVQPESAVMKPEEMNVDTQQPVAESPPHQSHMDCIKALFHGYQTERGTNDTVNTWSKLEYTSLFPVHVSHGNLHDALEAHQFLNDSGKEPWFETLPAVLIFSLGRYFFNGTKGETEKLNMRFHFPRTIYMDRYMASNYDYVSSIRETRNHLRNELSNVRAELKGLNEFPIGDRKEKLVNILGAALMFAKATKPETERMDDGTAVVSSPGPVSASKLQSFVEDKSAVTPVVSNSEQLLSFVPELENAINELQSKHKELCNRETELIKSIDEIYDREDLKQHGYRLHAVAIHQGQASAGHYWAYVRKGNDDSQWEKFNDQRVESAAWSDIEAEAVGGIRTTSAYFLLYVSSAAEPWLFSDDCPTSSFLMNEIREQVEHENAALESEIERYRCTQNEDSKGNAETSYELPRDASGKVVCAPPPPIGNEDELLSGTPLERALSDPENLAVPLAEYCDPLFTEASFEQEKLKLFSLMDFNSGTYPPSVTPDTVIDNQSKLMYRNVLKPMLIAYVRRAEASGVVDVREIYNKVISCFYDETDNISCSERSRPLRCLPDIWYTMGFRAPAKTMRFAIVRALLNAESEGILRCAREEYDEFMSVPYADHYVVLFQRASHLYDLVKTLWSVVRQVANDMNHNNAANLPRLSPKAVEMNIRMLRMVRAVAHLYARVYAEVGNIQGPNFQEHADYIIPSYIMRGISIIPVLWIFATIVQFLVDRTSPRDDIARLLTDSMGTIEIAIHQLAVWAQAGYKDVEKVLNHINETLGMIGLVFSATTTPLKREISRRIHGATQPNRHFDAPLQTFISQATDICYEVEQAACQLSLLGVADPAEADNVYTRLMAVVSDIINNAMQLDDKAGPVPPAAF